MRRALLSAVLGGAAALGCGGPGGRLDPTPQATLAQSVEAQEEFRALRAAWSGGSREERLALTEKLSRFRERHKGDPLARAAGALLAWGALERGDPALATRLAEEVTRGEAGSVRDLSLVVTGAALRRAGAPARSLEVLAPLAGKLVDRDVAALAHAEVVAAAVEAGAWEAAIGLVDRWFVHALEEERPAIAREVVARLAAVPTPVAEAALARRRAAGSPAELSLDTRRVVAGRLAQRVLSGTRDEKTRGLARRLLDHSGSVLGEHAEAVAEIAAGGGAARFEPLTLGLLLSVRSPSARTTSAEVAAGASHALSRPGPRLVTRHDDGTEEDVRRALADLAHEGASVIVGGLDAVQSRRLARFAAEQDAPVLLLAPFGPVEAGGAAFVIGEPPAREEGLLLAALVAQGVTRVVRIADAGSAPGAAGSPPRGASAPSPAGSAIVVSTLPCPDATLAFTETGFPVGAWRDARLDGLLLLGDATCSRRALEAAAPLPRARAGLGLAGASAELSGVTAPVVALRAGRYPSLAPDEEPASLRAWREKRGAPPGWWSALAHDAVLLAQAALAGLPGEATENPGEVRRRRVAARDALARISVELWTTEARGFGGGRVLARSLEVVHRRASP